MHFPNAALREDIKVIIQVDVYRSHCLLFELFNRRPTVDIKEPRLLHFEESRVGHHDEADLT